MRVSSSPESRCEENGIAQIGNWIFSCLHRTQSFLGSRLCTLPQWLLITEVVHRRKINQLEIIAEANAINFIGGTLYIASSLIFVCSK